MTFLASPCQTNPLNFSPFRDLLAESIDFERVRRQTIVKLFLCATNVQTAKVKIFEGKELDVQRLLACTCLSLLMQAVEVDGEFYWDGGYSGSPANCDARDILMVHITPAERPGVPTTSPAIINRMQEISFNTTLIREMRTIAYLNRQIEDGKLGGGKRMLVHLIEAEDLIRSFSWSSRLNGDWNFLQRLFELGRARRRMAGRQLRPHRPRLDGRSLRQVFLMMMRGVTRSPRRSLGRVYHVACALRAGCLSSRRPARLPKFYVACDISKKRPAKKIMFRPLQCSKGQLFARYL